MVIALAGAAAARRDTTTAVAPITSLRRPTLLAHHRVREKLVNTYLVLTVAPSRRREIGDFTPIPFIHESGSSVNR